MPHRFDRGPSFGENPARWALRGMLLVSAFLAPVPVMLWLVLTPVLIFAAFKTSLWLWVWLAFLGVSVSGVLAFCCRWLWLDLPRLPAWREALLVAACGLAGLPLTAVLGHVLPTELDMPWLAAWKGSDGTVDEWWLLLNLSLTVAGVQLLFAGATRWLVKTASTEAR